jgi:hypothetical protein
MKKEGQHHHSTTHLFQVKDKKKPTHQNPKANDFTGCIDWFNLNY